MSVQVTRQKGDKAVKDRLGKTRVSDEGENGSRSGLWCGSLWESSCSPIWTSVCSVCQLRQSGASPAEGHSEVTVCICACVCVSMCVHTCV